MRLVPNILLPILSTVFVLSQPFELNAQTGNCGTSYGRGNLETDYLDVTINVAGDMWWDLNGNPKYLIKDDSAAHLYFAGSLWMGGYDENGNLRLAAQSYRSSGVDYWPGPIDSTGATHAGRCFDFDFVTAVSREAIQRHQQLTQQFVNGNGGGVPIQQIDKGILYWPAPGNPYFRGQSGKIYSIPLNDNMAPYVEVDGRPGYDPVYGDYPDVPGDENLWWVFNDVGNDHSESGGEPLGVEVRALAYAFNSPESMARHTFYRYEIESHRYDLDSFIIGKWVDIDLGDYQDDFVGCDTVRNLAIGYNGDRIDGTAYGFGPNPPMTALQWLRTPDKANGQPADMAAFVPGNNNFGAYFANSPAYSLLNGRDTSGLGINCDTIGDFNTLMWPDDPSNTTGCSECAEIHIPLDRRYITAIEPISLPKGESVTVEYAMIYARCPDMYPPQGCPSFSCIQQVADATTRFYQQTITAVPPPHQPDLWRLYPNPASQQVTVSMPEYTHPLTFRIMDIQGRLVGQGQVTERQQTIQLPDVPAGLYLFQLTGLQRPISTQKLFIQP